MNIKIKDIPILDRPRERLINEGVTKLNNEELLAIILKTGTKEISAKLLASKLLSNVGGINNLSKTNYEEITKIKGIGEAKACTLLAVIELSKRMNKEIKTIKKVHITSTVLVYKYYKDIFKDEFQECFYCLYLDSQKKVIDERMLFKGTINRSLVHPREIFKEAYLLSASAIICIHNHPSGNVTPSIEDVELTNKLVDIGKLLGIQVLDHIIIGNDNYYSFYENNLLGGKNKRSVL